MIKTYFESTQQALASLCAAVLRPEHKTQSQVGVRQKFIVHVTQHWWHWDAEAAHKCDQHMAADHSTAPRAYRIYIVLHKTHMKNKVSGPVFQQRKHCQHSSAGFQWPG